GEEGQHEAPAPSIEQLVPSAFGMTFVLEEGCSALELIASWGHYSRGKSDHLETPSGEPRTVWQRTPAGGRPLRIDVAADGDLGPLVPDEDHPQVIVRGRARTREGRRMVTLFLVNQQDERERGGDAAWLFQAELRVRAPDGSPVFAQRALVVTGAVPEVDRAELASLDMLYRHEGELAVGHGVATHATHAGDDHTRAVELRTVAIPAAEVPLTEAPEAHDFDAAPAVQAPFARLVTDMKALGEASDRELAGLLGPLCQAYEAWIEAQAARIGDPAARLSGHEAAAGTNLTDCRTAARRIRAGIAALSNPDVAEAFRFANLAMWQQRVHTVAGERLRADEGLSFAQALEEVDEAQNRS